MNWPTRNRNLITLLFISLCIWLASTEHVHGEDIQVQPAVLSADATTISWDITYRGHKPELDQSRVAGGGQFSDPEVTTTGLRVAIYLDLWQICDPTKPWSFTEERFQAIIQPLARTIQNGQLVQNWNPETDKIAIFATYIGEYGDQELPPELQQIHQLGEWYTDLTRASTLLAGLTLQDHIQTKYNHANLTTLLSKQLFNIDELNDLKAEKLIILVSDGHDYFLHNQQNPDGTFIFGNRHAYSDAGQLEEEKRLSELKLIADQYNASIQPVYILPPDMPANYHGRRYLNSLASKFGKQLIDLDPAGDIALGRTTTADGRSAIASYENAMQSFLSGAVQNIQRTSMLTFDIEKLDPNDRNVALVKADGVTPLEQGGETIEIPLEMLTELAQPLESFGWTSYPTETITSTVTFVSDPVVSWSGRLPPLHEQDIRYEFRPIDESVAISETVVSSGTVEWIEDNRSIRVASSPLPADSYVMKLTSSNSFVNDFLANSQTDRFTVSPPAIPSFPWLLILAGLGLLLVLWALQKILGWVSNREQRNYVGEEEDTTIDVGVSRVGDGALLAASAKDREKLEIGRLLLVYGMNTVPVVQLSKNEMNFGTNPAISRSRGRNICLAQEGAMEKLQFHITFPEDSNRLAIYHATSGTGDMEAITNSASQAIINNTIDSFPTYLNDKKLSKMSAMKLSSGDIIRVGDHIKYRVVLNERYAGGRRMAYHQNGRNGRTNGNPLSRSRQRPVNETETDTEYPASTASQRMADAVSTDTQLGTHREAQTGESAQNLTTQTPFATQNAANQDQYIYDWRLRNRQMKSRQSSQGKKQTGFWARLWGDPAQATREQQALSRVADAIQEQTQSNGSFDSTIQQTDHFVADQDASHIEEDNAQHHSQAVAQIGKSERSNLKSGVPPSLYEPAADRGQPQAFQAGIGSDDSTQQSVPSGYPNRPTKTSSTSHQSAAVQPPDLSKEEPLKSTLGDQESVQQPIEDATQESKVDDKKKDDVDRKTNLEATRPRQATSLANPPDRNSERTKRDGLAKQIASERLPPSSTDRTESGDTAQFKSTTQSSKQSAIRSDEEQSESAIPNGLREEDDMTTQIRMVAFLPDENEDEGAVNDQPNDEDDKYRGKPKRTKT